MANLELLCKNLEERGFRTARFATAREAADYLNGAIDGVRVGIGGSVTVREMGLYERLAEHNRAIWHWEGGTLADAVQADVYITSLNGVAETGELINIDGNCNRVASSLYGHKKVYFVVGANKVEEDYDKALWRARNVAAPLNARRLGRNTPCARGEEMRCYDCRSPERICRGLVVLWQAPSGGTQYEVVLVDEALGY